MTERAAYPYASINPNTTRQFGSSLLWSNDPSNVCMYVSASMQLFQIFDVVRTWSDLNPLLNRRYPGIHSPGFTGQCSGWFD